MATRDRQLREALAHRKKAMDAEYSHWEPHFRELREWVSPSRGRFNTGEKRTDPSINKRILDSTATMALRTLRAGLMSGVTSPSRPWFRLGLRGPDSEESHAVKSWLYEVQRRMYEIMRGSNIYRMLDTCYGDLGLYGTFCGMVVPDFDDVLRGHHFQVGSYRIAEDGSGRVIAMQREMQMPVRSIVETWGLENVSDRIKREWDRGDYYAIHTICHSVEKRADADPRALKASRKPWASVYWEKAGESADEFLQIGGHSVKPLVAPRWDAVEGEAWSSSSPGMVALGDVRSLQVMQQEKAIAIQKMHNPPLIGSGITARDTARNIPGGVTLVNVADLRTSGLRPIYEVKPDIQGLLLDIQDTQRRVDAAFYRDLFQMAAISLEGRSQITAREIAERHEEKLMALGPVLESLDHELLQPLIEGCFAFMQDADILPPAPDDIVGAPIKVEYVSLLAQAQKAVGVGAIERTVGFAGSMAQLDPEAISMLNTEAIIREFADQVGPPPGMLRSPEEMEARRKASQQAAQQAQMVEAAQPLAGAAKLIAETQALGVDALQRGMPL